MIEKEISEKGNKCSLNHIDVSRIKNMSWLFSRVGYGFHTFEGDISKWDVSNVESMQYMFERNTYFNNDISNWKISPLCNIHEMFHRSTIKEEYKPKNVN